MLIYPVIESINASKPDEVVVAFTLFTPKTAQPMNGQVVQFRVKDKRAPKAAIVATGIEPDVDPT